MVRMERDSELPFIPTLLNTLKLTCLQKIVSMWMTKRNNGTAQPFKMLCNIFLRSLILKRWIKLRLFFSLVFFGTVFFLNLKTIKVKMK